MMLEALGPVISLFKLFIEGISTAAKTIRSSKKKNIYRKIIEIQLSLQDILDNAQDIISIIEKCCQQNFMPDDKIDRLERLLHRQYQRIYLLTEQINTHGSSEIMKLFTPEIRRNIIELIHIKGGFIRSVLRGISVRENVKYLKERLVIRVPTSLSIWDHDSFIREGRSYIRNIEKNREVTEIDLCSHFLEQKRIIHELLDCSERLSDFIKSQIGLDEVYSLINLK